MDPIELWTVLRRHLVVVATCILLGVSAAGGWTLIQTPEYQATSTGIVIVDPGTSGSSGVDPDERARSRATTYVALGPSRAIATKVIADVDLDVDPARLLARTVFEQPPDTSLVQVSVRSSSAEEARQLADAWLNALGERVADVENPSGGSDASSPRLAIIEPATTPDSPIYPRPPLNLAIGLAIGLVLGAASALLRDRSDRRIRTAADVKDRIGVGVVGEIPRSTLRRLARAQSSRTYREGRRRNGYAADPVFDHLRTQLQYLDVDHPPRSLLVTSLAADTDAAATVRELARAMAMHGDPVLLAELDFASPTMARDLGLDHQAGLLQALTGKIRLQDARQSPAGSDPLTYVVSGGAAPDPAELYGSRALRRAFETLNEDGFLLVHARPFFEEPAISLLSALVDAVVVVVPVRRTKGKDLRRLIDQLTVDAEGHLGVVLTGGRPATGGYASSSPVSVDRDTPVLLEELDEDDQSEAVGNAGKIH